MKLRELYRKENLYKKKKDDVIPGKIQDFIPLSDGHLQVFPWSYFVFLSVELYPLTRSSRQEPRIQVGSFISHNLVCLSVCFNSTRDAFLSSSHFNPWVVFGWNEI